MESPFARGRFEHESNHLYYLPESIVSKLEGSTPSYLIGARGSGKTTLLKALNWEERSNNEGLKRKLNGDSFRGSFIGVYVKLPTIQINIMDKWLKDVDDEAHGIVFGLYLDLVTVELLAGAVSSLIAKGTFSISPRDEVNIVKSWLAENPEYIEYASNLTDMTIRDCRHLFRKARKAIEVAALKREEWQSVLNYNPPTVVGELSRVFSTRLGDVCDKWVNRTNEKWHFKLCADETECLSQRQQVVLNTLVRMSHFPISYVLSYVSRPEDMTTTLYSSLTQQKADRHEIVLDDLSEPQFEELCQGVATERIREVLKEDAIEFSARSILGKLNINSMIGKVCESSKSAHANEITAQAIEFQGLLGNQLSSSDCLPFYESYLFDKLRLDPADLSKKSKRREQQMAEIRKKIVAAYLSICRELKVRKISYAAAEMVFGMSDNCIRDFLSQIHHVFLRAGKSLSEFISSEVSFELQSEALREASEEKRGSIPKSGVPKPVLIGRLVKGLARVTSQLQQGGDGLQHLRSPERGIFRIPEFAADPAGYNEIQALIEGAAEAGFLRIVYSDSRWYGFRVHSSLAPIYGFSYRGAYYPTKISINDLESLLNCSTEELLKEMANRICMRVAASEFDGQQKRLPFEK